MTKSSGTSGSRLDGRTTRWNGHKQQRRAEVLDAAMTVIEENGVDVSVQQIADRLRLPRPVVYRHFDGRADLDEQIRRRILESLLAELMPTLRADGTLKDAVRGAVGTYVGWVERHPNLHHFLAGDAPQRDSAALAGARDRIGGRLADLFATSLARFGIDPNRARPMAFGIIGFVDGVVNSWRADPATTLSSDQVEGILSSSVLALFEGNARSLGVPLQRDTLVADLLAQTDSVPAQ
ncbi:TetR/AcrR family transcriptional regulator [Nocardia sp. CDC159]|uniref:TetR/AcrR family transcriptional regulator n=1 Tax=Nocardia pulmonis TaxID=2951408 RepID=A0A9X2IYZ9_9NOCA|nr:MULTISPECIES: TetR/AcrR family transcriptional regulator [Nocardia]MCM6775480.1 TetR/AcrR family transcriptional regulator [Nocardia pulmonis]MCM6787786.1 TetR/AcrR family transcriptional regulator [Nocardia sp. CDC159]